MIEQIKLSMRISHDKLDNDIDANINACLCDLSRVCLLYTSDAADEL